MTPFKDSDILVKMLEQTNANIINLTDNITSRLERIENRQDQYHERLSEFVTRTEFNSTNERIVNDIATLVKKFESTAESLTANKITQDELVRRIEELEKDKVSKEQNELLNKRVSDLEKQLEQKESHKKMLWAGVISSLAMAVFEFFKDHFSK
jgi:chromosome segregation ATPase